MRCLVRREFARCGPNAAHGFGDHTLFTRADGIERLWEVAEPLLESPPRLETYVPGSWGPPGSDELIGPRHWRLPEPA